MAGAASDTYAKDISQVGPARNAVVTTGDDANDLAFVTRGIYVGVAGNIKVNMTGVGSGGIVIPVPAGLAPLAVSRIWATGTTATGIVAVW